MQGCVQTSSNRMALHFVGMLETHHESVQWHPQQAGFTAFEPGWHSCRCCNQRCEGAHGEDRKASQLQLSAHGVMFDCFDPLWSR